VPKRSAGLLMYRQHGEELQVFLVHPGGPYWANKDEGAWSIPKGEPGEDEDALAAAQREFKEETGCEPHGPFIPLAPVRQRSGKIVSVWAFRGDFNPAALRSNLFSLEWPPRSGKVHEFPEVDRGAWFSLATARLKIVRAQQPVLEELPVRLSEHSKRPPQE